jgi:hypothetical protein
MMSRATGGREAAREVAGRVERGAVPFPSMLPFSLQFED